MKLFTYLLSAIALHIAVVTPVHAVRPIGMLVRSKHSSRQGEVLKVHFQVGLTVPVNVLPLLVDRRKGAAISLALFAHLREWLRDEKGWWASLEWEAVFSGFNGVNYGYAGARVKTTPDGMSSDRFDAFVGDITEYLQQAGGVIKVEDRFRDAHDVTPEQVAELLGIMSPQSMRRDSDLSDEESKLVERQLPQRGGTLCNEAFDLRKYFGEVPNLEHIKLHFVRCPQT